MNRQTRRLIRAAVALDFPDIESGKCGIETIRDLLAPVADRFHPDLVELERALEEYRQAGGGRMLDQTNLVTI